MLREFKYKGLNLDGIPISGVIEASNKKAAVERINKIAAKNKLTIQDIRNGVVIHETTDYSNLLKGVRLHIPLLVKMMRNINRFMTRKLIEVWIYYCKLLLHKPRLILPHEFLILLTNSINRKEAIEEKLPKPQFGKDVDITVGII